MPDLTPDRAFIERAVSQADPNALRMALYQATRDPEIADIPAQRVITAGTERVVIDEADIARIQKLATDFLSEYRGGEVSEDLTEAELDELVQMAEARPISEFDLQMRRLLPSFGEHPHLAQWTADNRTPEGFSVAIVGGGFAGIAMAVQLEKLGIDYQLFERRHEVGGVWSINRYPDVRVDTLSALYQFGFEKRYPWTELFARQKEVRGYLDHVAQKYGVAKKIRLGHDVTGARYDDDANVWHLSLRVDGEETVHTANVIVTGSGLFANPKPLDLPGITSFAGQIVHTTEWSDDVTFAGRKVAVIGNGSTGVQLLSRIAEDAEQVYACQRTPQWISPRAGYGAPVEAELRWLIDTMPYYWNWEKFVAGITSTDLREQILIDHDWVARGGQVSERNDAMRTALEAYIAEEVDHHQDLIDQLIPDYPPMTRRPVVDNNWYRTLTRSNVELVSGGIASVTETGVVLADGRFVEVDLIVAAVGFDTQKYLAPAKYYGRDGVSLDEAWSERGPQAYLGMTVPNFPNMFMLYGPNSQPVASGTGLPCWFEIWTQYIGEILVNMLESGYAATSVRADVCEKYNAEIDAEAERLVYLADTDARRKNYYLNDFGRLQVVSPFTGEHSYSLSSHPDMNDYEMIRPGARRGGA